MSSKSAMYRKRVKEENPELYEQYLERARQAWRLKQQLLLQEPLTPAKEVEMERRKARQRLAQARYYARKRQAAPLNLQQRHQLQQSSPKSRKRPKDMDADEKREYNRLRQAESRARQSAQKKRRVREKERDRMRMRRAAAGGHTEPTVAYPSAPPKTDLASRKIANEKPKKCKEICKYCMQKIARKNAKI